MHHLAQKTIKVITWYVVLIVAAVIAIFIISYFKIGAVPQKTAVERASELDIKEFSMGGKISVLTKTGFTFQTGWVEPTTNGNQFVAHTKQVTITKDTKFFTVSADHTIKTATTAASLKVGQTINVYGAGNPYPQDTLTATKIEISR